MTDRRAIEVLNECAKLMRSKGRAYNGIPQVTYYDSVAPLFKDNVGGAGSIYVMMQTKMLRIMSLLAADNDNAFEGIDDSCRDLINYTAFMIEYLEGKMEGQ